MNFYDDTCPNPLGRHLDKGIKIVLVQRQTIQIGTIKNRTCIYTVQIFKVAYIHFATWTGSLTLSALNFRLHVSSALFFNKLSIGKKLICKVGRLIVKLRRSWWDGSLSYYESSHLDLCYLQKPIIIACGSERVKAVQTVQIDYGIFHNIIVLEKTIVGTHSDKSDRL